MCFVVCVPEISLSCNTMTKSRVDTQILHLGANFNNNTKDSIIKLTRMWVDRHNSLRHATIYFFIYFSPSFSLDAFEVRGLAIFILVGSFFNIQYHAKGLVIFQLILLLTGNGLISLLLTGLIFILFHFMIHW